MRRQLCFSPSENFEQKLLLHIESKEEFGFCFKGGGWGNHHGSVFETFAGFGIKQRLEHFDQQDIQSFIQSSGDYCVAHLGYDLKNRLENLASQNIDQVGFQELAFTIPKFVFIQKNEEWSLAFPTDHSSSKEALELIEKIDASTTLDNPTYQIPNYKTRVSKAEYLEKIKGIQRHIQRGNIYQANYCQEFYWENTIISPSKVFTAGFNQNPNPFSVYYKLGKTSCISFSPERFLSFDGFQLFSQPMKGTAPRDSNAGQDEKNKYDLTSSEKDRRENVMIVDLVRNDLSHFAKKGSVKVPELCEVRSYPKVHQMHSTVIADINHEKNFIEALFKAFPMGSMTGAPKISAMQVIEDFESTKRGLFSGSIGYFTPEGKSDFNVIIRSLLYHESSNYLSCHVGGGITILSDAEKEYEECMVKFSPINALLQSLS